MIDDLFFESKNYMEDDPIVEAFFKLVQNTDDIVVDVPIGTILYRANDIIEEVPSARYCNDTGKTGTYFSANSPYLAETMCTEYNKDMFVSKYKVTEVIQVVVGKYTFCDEDVSHIDPDVTALYTEREANERLGETPYAELFITQKQIHKIKYLGCYKFTVRECVEKWGYDDTYAKMFMN